VREFVKWDYELRAGQPVGALVDRALDIAMSEPRGPVYLCLPREVLADDAVPMRRDTVRPLGVAPPAPQLAAIEEAARLIAKAESPLIITSAMGRSPEAVAALAAFASAQAIPVLQINATDMNLPSDHDMNLGYGPDPNPHLAQADLVIVINSGVPWMPRMAKPKASAKVIHIGIDPLVSRYPFREYETDLLVAGDPAAAVTMLNQVLGTGDKAKRDARRRVVAAAREEMKAARDKMLAQAKSQLPIHPAWLAHCLNEAKAEDAIFINELGIAPNRLDFKDPLSFIGSSLAGGLGAGLGSALGAKLAAREREVVVAVGDGSYMFGNPVPYHFVQRAENLPVLTIVANNHSWLAVRQATLAVYPDGAAAKANVMPIQDLNPSPAFERVAECCDGWALSVEDPAKLPDAMKRAFEKVRSGVPALLNVHTQGIR
jgi:acetolactate synthase-1/2/3 large subunit